MTQLNRASRYLRLLRDAKARLAECSPTDEFETGIPEAERMLTNLKRYPHHFVLAALMDRQFNSGKVWSIPYRIGERYGFEFEDFAAISIEKIVSIFQLKHLHRYKTKMPEIFYKAIRRIDTEYDGDGSRIWSHNPSAARVVRRFLEFDGCGPKIATMATNILVRQFKVPMTDWSSIDISADVQVMKYLIRNGLLRPDAKKEEAIYLAREINPEYPGVLDLLAFEGGRQRVRR